MSLRSIKDIRREEFVIAALEVFKTTGLNGATLEQVAKQAGASKGIVLHYFKNKQRLFEAALRYGNAELRRDVVRRMVQAKTSEERLWALLVANFNEEQFRPNICQIWLSLCEGVPQNKDFRRLQTAIHARMNSNLISTLKPFLNDDEARGYAITLSSLIDGLWLRQAINAKTLKPDEALGILFASIQDRIPGFQVKGVDGQAFSNVHEDLEE